MLQRSFLGCRLRCALASPRPRLCWHAFACLPGPPSVRGCSAYELCSFLPRRTCLRLILFCTCPPLCAGRCGRCPPGSGVMSELFFGCFVHTPAATAYPLPNARGIAQSLAAPGPPSVANDSPSLRQGAVIRHTCMLQWNHAACCSSEICAAAGATCVARKEAIE